MAKAIKAQGKFRSAVEYSGVMLGYALMTRLPFAVSKAIATFLADVWRAFDRKHRTLALQQSMDRLEIDEESAKRLVKRNYRHYTLCMLEVCRLKNMPLPEVARRVELNGLDTLVADLLAEGKGMVAVTGHLGNWEWASIILGMHGMVEGFIARPLDNLLIDNFINQIRERGGAAVWDKKGSMRKALAALRNGRGFAAVMDQYGGRKGCRVPFLDRVGSTMAAPIDIAIRTGAPIFVGALIRKDEACNFVFVTKRIHRANSDADPNEERIRLATAVNEDLSEIIREYPEQWIWIHRRWK